MRNIVCDGRSIQLTPRMSGKRSAVRSMRWLETMRTYDPIEEFAECVQAVNAFLDSHRIDPYTPEEIAEIMRPVPKIPIVKLPPFEEYERDNDASLPQTDKT